MPPWAGNEFGCRPNWRTCRSGLFPSASRRDRNRILSQRALHANFERDQNANQTYPPGINALDYDTKYRGKLLRLKVTVEDDGVFTTPWSAVVIYGRRSANGRKMSVPRTSTKFNTENDLAIPTASKPDF